MILDHHGKPLAFANTNMPELRRELGGMDSDPDIYHLLKILPNPDPVLRKSGKTQEIYQDMLRDAHILGEVESMRSGLLSYEYKLKQDGTKRADKQALALAEGILNRKPAPYSRWTDVIWQIAQAELYGYRVHEVIWESRDGYLLPAAIKNRPNRRIGFNDDGTPRLRTRGASWDGIPMNDKKWLVTRHMVDAENPYGIAKMSACFWPWVFKSGGLKSFVRVCERFGIPWTTIKYPASASDTEINAFVQTLMELRDGGVLAYPDTGQLETVDTKSTGEVHSNLINLCNREMSKALRSQTLATEIQGNGSRAAAETHRGREQGVDESTRAMVEETFNQLLEWTTELNINNATAPYFVFYEEESPSLDWFDALDKARAYMRIPESFAHTVTNIPMAKDNETVLPSEPAPRRGLPDTDTPAQFSYAQQPRPGAGSDVDEWIAYTSRAADDILENEVVARIAEELEKSDTLADFQARLPELFPELSGKLTELNALSGIVARLGGMESQS